MHQLLLFTLSLSLLLGCATKKYEEYESAIINDSTVVKLELGKPNRLICSVSDSITSQWVLRYPVYQYHYGDINRDGSIDLAVGVIKETRYDSVKRKRLFLFQVRNNAIIPLWLGSSVGHPIVNFRVLQGAGGNYIVRILGQEKSDNYLVADYEWYGFGLTMTRYVKRETSLKIAKELLYNHI